jgi:hypothetical protein
MKIMLHANCKFSKTNNCSSSLSFSIISQVAPLSNELKVANKKWSKSGFMQKSRGEGKVGSEGMCKKLFSHRPNTKQSTVVT